jgi:hypothetical protein
MEDIYIKDKDGLRINALTSTQVNNQLFYILAESRAPIVFLFLKIQRSVPNILV